MFGAILSMKSSARKRQLCGLRAYKVHGFSPLPAGQPIGTGW